MLPADAAGSPGVVVGEGGRRMSSVRVGTGDAATGCAAARAPAARVRPADAARQRRWGVLSRPLRGTAPLTGRASGRRHPSKVGNRRALVVGQPEVAGWRVVLYSREWPTPLPRCRRMHEVKLPEG